MCYEPIVLKTQGISVNCGHCPECNEDKIRSWLVRCYHESTISNSSYFLTITEEDGKQIEKDGVNTLDKRRAQLFLKKLRKALGNYSFRYLLAGEYGDKTFRSHYHVLLFLKIKSEFNKLYRTIKTAWGIGNIKLEDLKVHNIPYAVRYVYDVPQELVELCEKAKLQKPFILSSRKPALGLLYLSNRKKQAILEDYRVNIDGFNYKLPRYYKNKIKETYEFLYNHQISKVQVHLVEQYWKERSKFQSREEFEAYNKERIAQKERIRLYRKSLL